MALRRKALDHVGAYLPLYGFLAFFFVTTVLANILYVTPWGRDWPAMSIAGFGWDRFASGLGAEYWLLLLLPFLVVPVAGLAVARAARPVARRVLPGFPELSLAFYLSVCVALYGYVAYSFFRADAVRLLSSGSTQVEAIEARFLVLSRLGFWPQAMMKSVLVFLVVWTVVKASRRGGRFWTGAVFVHVLALSTCLLLLNMKWPILIFILTLAMAVIVAARRHRLLKAAVLVAVAGVVYIGVSSFLLRLSASQASAVSPPGQADAPAADGSRSEPTGDRVGAGAELGVGGATAARSLRVRVAAGARTVSALMIAGINRMGVAAPFYYDVFSTRGQVCGTVVDRIVGKESPCQPSKYVYTEMFGDDGFVGRGTAPAAVQLSGYALWGWPGALLALAVASVLIGLFLALWPLVETSDIMAAVFVMGGYTGYFLSQLPVEGPIIYDHGLVWWALLLTAYWVGVKVVRRRSAGARVA